MYDDKNLYSWPIRLLFCVGSPTFVWPHGRGLITSPGSAMVLMDRRDLNAKKPETKTFFCYLDLLRISRFHEELLFPKLSETFRMFRKASEIGRSNT